MVWLGERQVRVLAGAPGGRAGVAVAQDVMDSVEEGALQGRVCGRARRGACKCQAHGASRRLSIGGDSGVAGSRSQTTLLGCCVGVGDALEQAVSTEGHARPPPVLNFIPPA